MKTLLKFLKYRVHFLLTIYNSRLRMFGNAYDTIVNGDTFTELFHNKVLTKYLTLAEQKKYRYFEEGFFKAFSFAKDGEYGESERLFAVGERELQKVDKRSTIGTIFLDTFYPRKAYFYYRTGEFERSVLLTKKSIIINQYLKVTLGADFLVFVQVQQYQNIARIFNKSERWGDAMLLNFDLLKLLLLKENLKNRFLQIKWLDQETKLLGHVMAYQILFDMLLFLNKMTGSRRMSFLNHFVSLIDNLWRRYRPESIEGIVLRDFLYTLRFINSDHRSTYSEKVKVFLTNKENLFPYTASVLTLFCRSE